jgi:hypothetical protein
VLAAELMDGSVHDALVHQFGIISRRQIPFRGKGQHAPFHRGIGAASVAAQAVAGFPLSHVGKRLLGFLADIGGVHACTAFPSRKYSCATTRASGRGWCGRARRDRRYVEHIISSPAASYTYAVGTGGAGASGTTGGAGGSGAAGIIIVEEYY